MRALPILAWSLVAALGALGFGVLALHRGETISAAWLLLAAVCTWAVGYRFYSRIISHRIFALDDARPTPAVRLDDGRDFVPTERLVVFGHHFAAIAGAGPLVGPILAAQFGYLPGTIWIIVGVVLAGAVQDLVILCASLRHDGRSLGALAREHIGPVSGWTALVSIVVILAILIAVLAMVVVKALAESPWGTVTIACTIPIAVLMGLWMRHIRPGRVLEASLIGLVMLAAALWLGRAVAADPAWAPRFTLSAETLSWLTIAYGFVAAVLPVWMLLAPRDYLSSFVKIGTVLLLAAGILVVLPDLRMPALTSAGGAFAPGGPLSHGQGPVFSGSLLPFAFITIACGAISGFHSLVASGTTPRLIRRETDARLIGYGGMLMEAFVAVMALIAACALSPGLYFALNSPAAIIGGDAATAAATISSWGFQIGPEEIRQAASDIGEPSILSRTGGAPTLAIGMAYIFSSATSVLGWSGATAVWYHFAILFEALFILTTIDAGTRVGRFAVQDVLGRIHPACGHGGGHLAVWLASALVVASWGWFLIAGVRDPLGGIYMLWPLFGIANQVLAALALCVGTVIIVRMGRWRWAWITVLPLCWLLAVTQVAGWQKLCDPSPKVGFLAAARAKDAAAAALEAAAARDHGAAAASLLKGAGEARIIARNNRIDAVLCASFLLIILVVAADALRACWIFLRRRGA